MENHPIPQDITGFQFKLIGNMTIKQFAYLAAGVILAWISYVLPVFILIKLPFCFLFAGSGAAFAFLPFEGRPLDVMITNFFKAIFNPTQYVYQKIGGQLYIPVPVTHQASQAASHPTQASLSGDKLKAFLNSLPKKPKNKLDEKEMTFFQSLNNMTVPQTISAPSSPAFTPSHVFSKPGNEPEDTDEADVSQSDQAQSENSDAEDENLKKEADQIEKALEEAKVKETKEAGSKGYIEAHQKVVELETQLSETFEQKQKLEKELLSLKKQLEQQGKQIFKPSMATPEKEATRNVRVIPKGMGNKAGLPITSEFPNIIAGIVKDPRSNPLGNILVEVKDHEGNPVRAFKTNALGQFASATPLTNGTYTIEFEDPKGENKFDEIEFTAAGGIILPIEVISVDNREELRRSLFN